MSRSIRPSILLAAAYAIPAGWCSSALAAEHIWTGRSTTSSDWSDPANWSGGVPSTNGTADISFQATPPPSREPTHGPWTIHRLVFKPTAASVNVGSTGPLTFVRDPSHTFVPQPLVANDSSQPSAVRGSFILPADAILQARAPSGTLTLGDAAGSRLNGGGGTRGGTLLLNSNRDRLVFNLDNSATSAADRGLHLSRVGAFTGEDEPFTPVHQAHLTIVAADPNYAGTGSGIDVGTMSGFLRLQFQPDGAAGNSVGFAPTNHGPLEVFGDQRAPGVARQGAAGPRVVFNGLSQGDITTAGNVTITGGGAGPSAAVDGTSGGGSIRVEGVTTFGSALPDASKTFRVGHNITVVPVTPGATAAFDPTLGASGDVVNRRTEYEGTVTLRTFGPTPSNLVFRSSAHVTSGPAMHFDGTIAGTGAVKLEQGSADIAFSPATRIRPGEFDRYGELRFEGTGAALANFATPERLTTVAGFGAVEFRRTDNQPFDLAGNVWSEGLVSLKVTDSNPSGLDARLNGAGGTNFAGSVLLERGASIDVAGNRIAGADGTGTLVGPATFGNLTPGLPGIAGTLTLIGEPTSLTSLLIRPQLQNGPDQYGRVHATDDLTLVGADGSPTRLITTAPFGGQPFQELTIVQLDAGATLTGEFLGLPDGARIESYYTIRYNVDGGDGSANDIVLTLVPEPGAAAIVVAGAGLLLRRKKRGRA